VKIIIAMMFSFGHTLGTFVIDGVIVQAGVHQDSHET
jgi:hypothetical protein